MANKPRGKPFQKGNKGGGRKKKTVTWKAAEEMLREAIPRVLMMSKNELALLLQANPTGAEMVAAKFIHEETTETVNRFLGKVPNIVTGDGGTIKALLLADD